MARPCQRCGYENDDESKFCRQCGAMIELEIADAADPLIGKILLGRYRVVRVLGEGGMGKVYLAEQKMGTATRDVAIKTLHPELSSDPQLVARFHRECETVIELHHPNTVQFYDFGDLEDKTLFIVMEYIEGEDLARRLHRVGPLDTRTIDKILIQVCGSLAEAHERGIVHRDLKPENVLLTTRGGQTDFVKVLDFGIAKRSEAEDDAKAKLTKQGMVLGTPPYMSPEQFSGQTLDLRSDVYSLAVMTYEMVTGRLPFEANTPWEWATKHLTAQPTPLDAYPQGAALPVHKKNAILRALAKNREERHPNALAFMHEFTGIHDAQAAWTMATTTGLSDASSAPGLPPPSRQPVGTPQPMAQTGGVGATGPLQHPVNGGTPAAVPQHPTPAPTEYPSGALPTLPTNGGRGWVVALALVFVLLGGAAGGGLWWWSRQGPSGDEGLSPAQNPQLGSTSAAATTVTMTEQPTAVAMVEPTMAATVEPTMAAAVEPTMVAAVEPTMVEPTMVARVEPTMVAMVEPTMGMGMAGGADVAAAQAAVRQGEAALARNDLEGAVAALQRAIRHVGRRHPSVRSLKNRVASRGSNTIGALLLQGNCPGAQRLYRRLSRVGAQGPARQHFSGDWCRRP